MRSFLASLRTLVLPFGTTTGTRIVLDGVNGEIDVYDAADTLVVRIDENGLFVDLGTGEALILPGLGEGIRVSDGSGGKVQLTTDPAYGALVELLPDDVPGVPFDLGLIYATSDPGFNDAPTLGLIAPAITGRTTCSIQMTAEDNIGTQSFIYLTAQDGVTIPSGGIYDIAGMKFVKGQQNVAIVNVAAASSSLTTVTFPIAFQTGHVPVVHVNFNDAPAAAARWTVRAINISESQFDIFMRSIENPAVAGTFTMHVGWSATVQS